MAVESVCSCCHSTVNMLSLTKLGDKMLCKGCIKPYICEGCGKISEDVQPHVMGALDPHQVDYESLVWMCNFCWLKLNQQPIGLEKLN